MDSKKGETSQQPTAPNTTTIVNHHHTTTVGNNNNAFWHIRWPALTAGTTQQQHQANMMNHHHNTFRVELGAGTSVTLALPSPSAAAAASSVPRGATETSSTSTCCSSYTIVDHPASHHHHQIARPDSNFTLESICTITPTEDCDGSTEGEGHQFRQGNNTKKPRNDGPTAADHDNYNDFHEQLQSTAFVAIASPVLSEPEFMHRARRAVDQLARLQEGIKEEEEEQDNVDDAACDEDFDFLLGSSEDRTNSQRHYHQKRFQKSYSAADIMDMPHDHISNNNKDRRRLNRCPSMQSLGSVVFVGRGGGEHANGNATTSASGSGNHTTSDGTAAVPAIHRMASDVTFSPFSNISSPTALHHQHQFATPSASTSKETSPRREAPNTNIDPRSAAAAEGANAVVGLSLQHSQSSFRSHMRHPPSLTLNAPTPRLRTPRDDEGVLVFNGAPMTPVTPVSIPNTTTGRFDKQSHHNDNSSMDAWQRRSETFSPSPRNKSNITNIMDQQGSNAISVDHDDCDVALGEKEQEETINEYQSRTTKTILSSGPPISPTSPLHAQPHHTTTTATPVFTRTHVRMLSGTTGGGGGGMITQRKPLVTPPFPVSSFTSTNATLPTSALDEDAAKSHPHHQPFSPPHHPNNNNTLFHNVGGVSSRCYLIQFCGPRAADRAIKWVARFARVFTTELLREPLFRQPQFRIEAPFDHCRRQIMGEPPAVLRHRKKKQPTDAVAMSDCNYASSSSNSRRVASVSAPISRRAFGTPNPSQSTSEPNFKHHLLAPVVTQQGTTATPGQSTTASFAMGPGGSKHHRRNASDDSVFDDSKNNNSVVKTNAAVMVNPSHTTNASSASNRVRDFMCNTLCCCEEELRATHNSCRSVSSIRPYGTCVTTPSTFHLRFDISLPQFLHRQMALQERHEEHCRDEEEHEDPTSNVALSCFNSLVSCAYCLTCGCGGTCAAFRYAQHGAGEDSANSYQHQPSSASFVRYDPLSPGMMTNTSSTESLAGSSSHAGTLSLSSDEPMEDDDWITSSTEDAEGETASGSMESDGGILTTLMGSPQHQQQRMMTMPHSYPHHHVRGGGGSSVASFASEEERSRCLTPPVVPMMVATDPLPTIRTLPDDEVETKRGRRTMFGDDSDDGGLVFGGNQDEGRYPFLFFSPSSVPQQQRHQTAEYRTPSTWRTGSSWSNFLLRIAANQLIF